MPLAGPELAACLDQGLDCKTSKVGCRVNSLEMKTNFPPYLLPHRAIGPKNPQVAQAGTVALDGHPGAYGIACLWRRQRERFFFFKDLC